MSAEICPDRLSDRLRAFGDTKIFSNTVETGLFAGMSGTVKFLPVSYLPLQLCSLQIFFMLYQLLGHNEKRKADLNCFMCMCMLVGAPFAILLPAYSTSFTDPGSYQLFLYHDAIIIYALINAMPPPDVNDKLFCEGEETLY